MLESYICRKTVSNSHYGMTIEGWDGLYTATNGVKVTGETIEFNSTTGADYGYMVLSPIDPMPNLALHDVDLVMNCVFRELPATGATYFFGVYRQGMDESSWSFYIDANGGIGFAYNNSAPLISKPIITGQNTEIRLTTRSKVATLFVGGDPVGYTSITNLTNSNRPYMIGTYLDFTGRPLIDNYYARRIKWAITNLTFTKA